MGLEPALKKSWEDLLASGISGRVRVTFVGGEYAVDAARREVVSLPGGAPAEDHVSILILHYLARRSAGLPAPRGEYLGFHGLSAVPGFAEGFKKRATDLLLERYGEDPSGLGSVPQRLPAVWIDRADVAIVVDAFEGVPVVIELWKATDEFAPEANLLFDKSITKIFCVEDIVVLAEVVARAVSSSE